MSAVSEDLQNRPVNEGTHETNSWHLPNQIKLVAQCCNYFLLAFNYYLSKVLLLKITLNPKLMAKQNVASVERISYRNLMLRDILWLNIVEFSSKLVATFAGKILRTSLLLELI